MVDTGAPDADERLRALEPALYAGLLALRRRVLDDPASVATITRQFAMKNTMGYGINALLDFDTASEILAHLLVGSEGTLAFVASATFRTVPLRAHAATALLVFDDLVRGQPRAAGPGGHRGRDARAHGRDVACGSGRASPTARPRSRR